MYLALNNGPFAAILGVLLLNSAATAF
uniref:Uncharacterized protein n=1 Tax=Arundo donax TaxID=35708 RepID=A0A0A9EPJ5_ARUDO